MRTAHVSDRYTDVDTSTLEGLKRAEQLQARGWIIVSSGLFIVRFFNPNPDRITRKNRIA